MSKKREPKVMLIPLGASSIDEGQTGVVTGSSTLVIAENGEKKYNILVDCGNFQGKEEALNKTRNQEIASLETINAILLTHCHYDHCGGLGYYFKLDSDGPHCTGKVYASRETCSQASHILMDSAILNSIKASKYISKKKETDFVEGEATESEEQPMYTVEDVERVIRAFSPIDFYRGRRPKEITLFEGISAKFIPVAHINGSCMIELTIHFGNFRKTIVFTGDIGKDETLLYRRMSFHENKNADTIVMEGLHGIEEPQETLYESTMAFKKILKKAMKNNKIVIIPTFALDRSAGIIKILNDFMDQGMHIPCYLDSPLAERELYCYINSYNDKNSDWFRYDGPNPFRLDRFKVISNAQDHFMTLRLQGFNVIICSSGMGYGGRVVDYFNKYVQNPNAIFVFPGFLVEDCPSRRLVECEKGKIVELNEFRYLKHCETIQFHGFSSHGYYEDKLKILKAYPKATKIFLNHGEQDIVELEKKLAKDTNAKVSVFQMFHKYEI